MAYSGIWKGGHPSPFLPSLPFPSLSFPSLPLEVGPLTSNKRIWGSTVSFTLPQWGLGWSCSRNWIGAFSLHIWIWQQQLLVDIISVLQIFLHNFSDFSIGATFLRLHFWPYARFFTVQRGAWPVALIPVGSWGHDPTNFSPARVRILVDPGLIFTRYKCIINLALL